MGNTFDPNGFSIGSSRHVSFDTVITFRDQSRALNAALRITTPVPTHGALPRVTAGSGGLCL
jgi:hypothetical protein